MARTTRYELKRLAVSDMRAALQDLGAKVTAARGEDNAADLIVDVGGQRSELDVTAFAAVSGETAVVVSRGRPSKPGAVRVVVADRISGAAKEVLRDRGWGWLDRTHGQLVLRGRGLLVETRVDPIRRIPEGAMPARLLAGRAAKAWAAALLMHPDDPPSIRDVARRAEMGSATVGEAAKRLRQAALVRPNGRPLVPELFWELAGSWSDDLPTPLANAPTNAQLRAFAQLRGRSGVQFLKPVLSGTAGAVFWGAPIVTTADAPPDFYVPGAAAVHSLERRLGRAERFEDRAASAVSPPTLLVCSEVYSGGDRSPYAVAHPLFVALDLAQDRGRGREILDEFTPKEPFSRVW